MGTIALNNIRLYAHHGCLSEETKIGSEYRIDVVLKADLRPAAQSDALKDTVDYVHINHIVATEMQQPSKLLEHVAQRIINRAMEELPLIDWLQVSVAKVNPPIGGDVQNVQVTLESNRN